MKKIFTCLFFCWHIVVSAQQSISLSLDQAIAFAAANQPQFQNYKIDQQISDAKKLESVTKYLPKLNGTVDFRDNLKLGEIALKFPNPITGLDENRRIQQGTTYSGTAGVDLTQPLLDMNAVSDIKIAKAQRGLTNAQLDQAMIDLKVNVTRSYYLVLLNQERVAKAEKSVERFDKAYKDTKVKFDNQNALKTDLNRAYLNWSNSKYQLKVTQDSIKSSIAAFAQLIGLPTDATVELSDKLPSEIKQPQLPEYPDLKGAELSRVELRAEVQQMQVNKLQLNKINYQYIPSLNGYGYIGGQGLDNTSLASKDKWFWTSYIGMRLQVPIFDGLQKMALARQQKYVLQKNENNIKTIRNSIHYQLQTTAINYANAAKNLELIQENVKLAEEVVKDVNVRYQNSVAGYQEVLDAESTLKETEFNYLQSLYTFLLAELEWKKANGKL
ncbi:MAG: TolC family protein [Bacteroidetes bacterium]|nr:TolC family protein [Bacteroidota bacterium]